jgi:hypothetical protein
MGPFCGGCGERTDGPAGPNPVGEGLCFGFHNPQQTGYTPCLFCWDKGLMNEIDPELVPSRFCTCSAGQRTRVNVLNNLRDNSYHVARRIREAEEQLVQDRARLDSLRVRIAAIENGGPMFKQN